jgi:hypothetical protein
VPTITNAAVRIAETGQVLRADCFGNNAAIECPKCCAYPVLLIARPNQRGSSVANPGVCRHCGCRTYIVDDLAQEELQIVNVAVG